MNKAQKAATEKGFKRGIYFTCTSGLKNCYLSGELKQLSDGSITTKDGAYVYYKPLNEWATIQNGII